MSKTQQGHASEQTGGDAEQHHHGHGARDHHEHHRDRSQPHNHGHDHEDHHGGKETDGTILTVRAASGLSGDMMLSGLAALAGVKDTELEALVRELKLPALDGVLKLEARSVNHIAGVGCRINLPPEHAHRSLADIRGIIEASAMPEDARELSVRAFTILGEAEAAVHGKEPDQVHFHEVGALDSILDTCLVCRLFTIIKPDRFICSPLPIADGVIHCAHGHVASPAPAVLRLLEGIPVISFPGTGETVTPTAVSLLRALGAHFGGWPAMTVRKTVISYGGKVFENAPNGAIWALGASGRG